MRRDPPQLLIFFILLIGGFLFYQTGSAAKVLISKIQIAGVSTTDEFVEIYNFSSSSASLLDWSLKKQTAGGTLSNLVSSFPSSTVLKPFGYYLIANRDYTPIGGIVADLNYSNNSTNLATNNSLLLFDNSGTLADRVDWGAVSTTSGTPAPDPAAGTSLVRLPNDDSGDFIDSDDSSLDFIDLPSAPYNSLSPSRPVYSASADPTESGSADSDPPPTDNASTTPETNSVDTSSLWAQIKINELVSNPATGTEWVELYNPNTSSLDLAGGTLCDNRSSDNCTIANLEGAVLPQSWLTVFLSGSHLNNDGDSVILKNPSGEPVDRVDYTSDDAPDKGQSLARTADGVDTDSIADWAVTLNPTPGSQNSVVLPPPPTQHSGSGSTSGNSTVATTSKPTSTKKTTASAKTATPKDIPIVWKLQTPNVFTAGSSSQFDAHLSADPRGGEIMFRWNFGDTSSTIDGALISHTYATSGIYTVSVWATSSQGTIGITTFSTKVIPNLPVPEGIIISGLSPHPEAEDEEWISVSNLSTSTADLSSWHLGTGNDKWYTFPSSTLIRPSSTLRFSRLATHLVLNNEGGTIYLTDQFDKTVDLLEFDKGLPGQSYSLSGTTWEWLPKIDPNTTTGKVLGEKISASKKTKTVEAPQALSINDARSAPLSTAVIIKGSVESAPKAPGSNYFYIKDQTGGIQIYSYKKLFPRLTVGQTVRVSGVLSSIQGLPRVKTKSAADIVVLSKSSTIEKNSKAISEIDESDFGTLVTLEGDITKKSSTYLYLDDGTAETIVSLPPAAGIDKSELKTGLRLRVTGIIDQNSTGWRLTPRTAADLIILKPDPEATTTTSSAVTLSASPASSPPIALSATTNIALGAGALSLIAAAFLSRKLLKKK